LTTKTGTTPGLAIAFGAGGARALGSLGVMSVLAKHGIEPAAVSGSSMGSIIAAYYGVHGQTETLRTWYEEKKTGDYLSYMTRPSVTAGWIDTHKLQNLIDGFLKKKQFKDTLVPVNIVCTDLRRGKETVYRHGPLINPVMASIAIPGVIHPHKIRQEYFVDGGVTNPTPADVFLQKYTHTLAIDFHFHVPKHLNDPSMMNVFMRSFMIAQHAAFEHHKTLFPKNCTILAPKTVPGIEDLRFDKARQYILFGERAGKTLIRQWKRNGVYEQLIETE